jgi:transposase
MKLRKVYVGLDYHKAFVQVCVLDPQGKVLGNRRCANDWLQIVEWVHTIGRPDRTAIEACGGAADLAEQLVSLAGWSVDLAHPGYVARLKGSPDKSDFSDSRLLADLTRVGYLPKVWLAPEAIRELRRLVRFRQQLADERRSTKLRIRALVREHRLSEPQGKPWTKRWLAWLMECEGLGEQSRWLMDRHLASLARLQEEIGAVEQRLMMVTKDDPMIARLMEQPGIGPVTAWTIRAEIGRFDRFTSGKQLARFCGLSPRNASSGERQADAGLIKAGNPQLRAVLIEAAWRLIRCDARWKSLAKSMVERGKPKCLAAAAIANRWLRGLYHEMKPLGLATAA